MNRKIEREISSSHLESFPTKNGTIAEDNIRFAKENLLFEAMRHSTDLVEMHQMYPTEDKSVVRFDLDIVIVSKSRYQELKDIENKYKSLCN